MVFRKREDADEDCDASGELFNTLLKNHNIKNDKSLAEWLGVSSGYISKIRHGVREVNAEVILAIHEKVKLPVEEIRRLIRTGGLRS